MCNRPRYLHREPKCWRSAVTPLRVGGKGVWPVERRIDLGAIELTSVALQMRSSRAEARRGRARNRPTCRPDPDARNPRHDFSVLNDSAIARRAVVRPGVPWDTR